MSLPPVVAPVQNDVLIDLEPDEVWKDDLRDRINQAFASMVQQVDTAYQGQIEGKSDHELGVLKLEHDQTMTNIRNFKEESFTIELERERQERRWVSGARMLPEWSNALVKEQHQILKSITGQIEMTKKSSQSNDSNEGPPQRPKTPTNVAKWNEVTQERKDRSMQGLERMIRDGRWRTNPSNSSGTPDHQVGNGSSKVTEIVDPEEEQRRTRQQEVFRHREQQILERKRQNKLKTFFSGFKSADSSKSSASSGASTVILASPTKEDTSMVALLPLLASSPSFPDSFDDAISNMAQEPQPLSALLEGQSIDGYPGSGTDPLNVNVYAFTVPKDNPNGVDASQSKQDLLKRKEEDISQREVAVGQREEELAKLEESISQREEQLRKREDEAIHRADKRQKELESKEQELLNLENELRAREKATSRTIEALTSRARNSLLRSILADTDYHRRLLKCVGSDAQTLLDAFQTPATRRWRFYPRRSY
ncbi:hypothetical protein H0H93_002060 [Arthromyces matolae]|nr:hypothetical protein H0H93_002060 [Arthromyces matolae]